MDRASLPAPRFDEHINIHVKTFGSDYSYQLITLNVSKTGLLTGSAAMLPFQKNTLLEMLIDPGSGVFAIPIPCIGKVTRIATEPRPEQEEYTSIIGISISEHSDPDTEIWKDYIERLEIQLDAAI